MISQFFVLTFILLFCVQIVYWFIFLHFALWRRKSIPHFNEPISIVIVARNEDENLQKNLPLILEQDYPDFEVIVVNDRSVDNTRFVIEDFQKKYAHLKLTQVNDTEEFWMGKKYGLTLGIKAAKNNHLLLTDADCYPHSKKWIRMMASGFEKNQLILGFGAYETKPGFLNKLIRYETLVTAVQYFSYAQYGAPYMGVGRNIAYTKELFFQNRGFVDHMHIPSGDDDLFVNAIANKNSTTIIAEPEAHTISRPKETWKDWKQQKRRHLSTSNHYKKRHKLALGLYGLTQVFFPLLFLISIFTPYFKFFAAIAGFRLILQWMVLFFSNKKIKQPDVVILHPLLDIILPYIIGYWMIQNKFQGKPKRW